jgi:fructose-bisphosphate aldolase, class I
VSGGDRIGGGERDSYLPRVLVMTDLSTVARTLLSPGKGILAADESVHTADKRLADHGIVASPEMRHAFHDLFFSAPGIEEYLSGVILFTEQLEQKGSDKKLFPKSLAARGIIPGIKVDEGTEPFPESPDELITRGVIGLCDRLIGFHKTYGTGFTKWRAVIRIEGDRLPTAQVLVENARRIATYARDAQEVSMVPIVEPEVLYEGTHSRMRAKEVLETTLHTVFDALTDHAVDLSGVILKTSMVLSGAESGRTDSPEEVAEATVDALMATVPPGLAGIVFLSGGQTPDQATENLRAIAARVRETGARWPVTFSFARALQEEALNIWQGKKENVPAAQEAFRARLQKVSEALG